MLFVHYLILIMRQSTEDFIRAWHDFIFFAFDNLSVLLRKPPPFIQGRPCWGFFYVNAA